ncbi:hypothetical protein [Streptomyces sp. CA-111067]|uniref:hypothetical protein n=1 Tax=Streptomyces sp. CA-111067 TaxID=3240046 RepID=UPI003D9592FB
MSTTEIPRGDSGPDFLRLQVELVLEVSSSDALRAAALDRIAADPDLTEPERVHARAAAGEDESEALAYLVDPGTAVQALPGIALVQASWSCAHTEYDPDAESDDWSLGDDEEDEGEDEGDAGAETGDEGGDAGSAARGGPPMGL